MKHYTIAVIPGDGIGKEVAPEGVRVLDAVAEMFGGFKFSYEYYPWGCEYYLKKGEMMPENGLEILKPFDAIFFGAVGFPNVPDHISLHGLLIKMRLGFDQYICLRPSILLPGVKTPLAGRTTKDIDLVVVRENTEGEYTGAGGRSHAGSPLESAIETSVFTRKGVERVVRYAFELARTRPRKKLTSVTKSNAQRHIMTFWDEVFKDVAKDYPDVSTESMLVDAMAARFILHPEAIDTVVASNLFGDILTDIGGAISGSLGLSPSGNINPERAFPSMFEPVHGSAPDIFGKAIANPLAMIWSGAMMIDFLGQAKAGDLIVQAIKTITGEGKVLTPDLGGNAKTPEVTDAVLTKMRSLAK